MNSDNNRFYRYFSFDLSMKLLEQYYPGADLKKAWSDILKHMTSNGFEHRQYSGYMSQNKLDEIQTYEVAFKLFNSLNWLANCAKRFDSTAIINEQNFDFLMEFKKQNPLLYSKLDKENVKIPHNPPVLDREDFSLSKKQNSSKPAIPPTPTKLDTVTLPLEELKEIFETGVDMNVTVKKEELEKAKKQVEDKKQQSTAPKKTTAPSEQKKINKPKR